MTPTLGVGRKGISDGLAEDMAPSEGGKTVITYWCRKWFGGEVEKRKWARNFKTADLSWPTD
jgi:hypothetical protein